MPFPIALAFFAETPPPTDLNLVGAMGGAVAFLAVTLVGLARYVAGQHEELVERLEKIQAAYMSDVEALTEAASARAERLTDKFTNELDKRDRVLESVAVAVEKLTDELRTIKAGRGA